MARPFSIARAFDAEHERILQGILIERGDLPNREPIAIDDRSSYCSIDSDTLSFNTGFVDCNGVEIFTGDILDIGVGEYTVDGGEVVFDSFEGAFFIKRQPHTVREIDSTGDFTLTLKTRQRRLKLDNSKMYRIVSNIYKEE